MRIILASGNKGKISELDQELKKKFSNIELVGLDTYPDIGPLSEPGMTFQENAMHKGKTIAHSTNLPSLADDSGLEVDFLNGAPGVFSARFSREGASDLENNQKLLKLLREVPLEKRTARFRCVLVAYSPDNQYIISQGVWEGKIATQPRGNRGFGYDPLFIDKQSEKTAAEMQQQEKNQLSHRGRAIADLTEKLDWFLKRLQS